MVMSYPFATGIQPTLLEEVGLERLGPDQRAAALRTIAAELELRVAARLWGAMTALQRAELDRLVSSGTAEDLSAFYNRTFPNHARIAAEELEHLKAEVRANLAIELAFEGLSPIYHDAMVRLDAMQARGEVE